jgi:hypothetical protein
MDIEIRIGQLVLDGVDVPRRDRDALHDATIAELTRLLADGGLSPALRSGGAMRSLPGASIQLPAGHQPTHLGQQIARAVYGGLGKQRPGR